jgi:hypothetical protein
VCACSRGLQSGPHGNSVLHVGHRRYLRTFTRSLARSRRKTRHTRSVHAQWMLHSIHGCRKTVTGSIDASRLTMGSMHSLQNLRLISGKGYLPPFVQSLI